jgi:CDP-diglyceride synthetase
LIEIIFIILIAILFFWDLITFYNKKNLKIHRIIIPVGILGSLIYIYLSHQTLFTAIKNSLSIIIIAFVAFLIIISIKTFLNIKKLNIEEKNNKHNNLLQILEFENLEKKINILNEKIENLNFNKFGTD